MKNLFFLSALGAMLIFSACSKDKNSNKAASRNVKYEITGSATGSFTMVYTNSSGVAENVTVQSLPWSKELTVQNSVQAVIFTANGTTTPGKVAVANLYIGNKIEQTATQTANSNGTIVFGGLNFTY
ncbi:MAG TPA: MmpS family transport accessory protein [Pelobium sp.]